MKTKSYWMWAIEKRPRKVEKVIGRLFNKPTETKEFLEAVIALIPPAEAAEGVTISSTVSELVTKIREKFLGITIEQFEACFKLFESNSAGPIIHLLGGTRQGELALAQKVVEKLIELAYHNPFPDKRELDKLGGAYPYSWLVTLLTLSAIGATFTWPNLLSKASQEEDLYARKTLRDLLWLFCLYRGVAFERLEPFPLTPSAERSPATFQQVAHSILSGGVLPVPLGFENLVETVASKVYAEIEEQQKDLRHLLEQFSARFSLVEEKYNEMWQEMQEHPRYLLRPNGLDKVKLEITALRKAAGYHMVQLFAAEPFPNTTVKFWLKGPDGSNWSVTQPCEFFSLAEFKVCREMRDDDPRVWMDRLLLFIATDCLWRIICGHTRTIAGGGPVRNVAPESTPSVVYRSGSVVRAHLRRLPLNFMASPQALRAAQHTIGVALPSGFTFVREHLRGPAEIEMFSNPIFSYGDKDLGM